MIYRIATALFLGAVLTACGSSSPGSNAAGGTTGNNTSPPTQRSANIRWTRFGIPHIQADDWQNLGYGVGYAFAWDNLCTLADEFVMIDGERSRYFGPEAEHAILGRFGVTNRENDFSMKLLVNDTKTAEFAAAQNQTSTDLATGYADGYNQYVRELRAGEHPGRHAACANEPWLREITVTDLYRRYIRLAMLASSTVFRDGIANAAPPPTGGLPLPLAPPPADTSGPAFDNLRGVADLPIGSNMYGLGADGTEDGSTMLFGNPHFPWYGPERLHAFHVTIPGVINSMGSGLHGVPIPLIAFTENFAWSHTVSAAYRFTVYELSLNPVNPLQYLKDGAFVDMTPHEISIEVMQPDGSLATETRTLYTTEYGPVTIVAENVLDWSPVKAYAIRDANYENTRLIEQFIAWNTAEDLEAFKQAQADVLAVPWVNTVAVGPDAPAYYADLTVVPNVPDEMLTPAPVGCAAEPVHSVVQQLVPGLPVLDGSRSACAWRVDADSPQEGTFGVANLPSLERDDYVHNCNDSYWLTHPDEPVTGFARIIGDEDAARSLRTRLCIIQLQQRLAGEDGLANTRFTLEQLQEVTLSSRVYTAELARDDVVANLCGGATGDMETACTTLANWDLTTEVDSVGAHIWREFWNRASASMFLWNTPFDVNDPVNTPRDLNTGDPTVAQALTDAVAAITAAGIDLDARFGTVQYDVKNGQQIEMFGGLGSAGNFTITIPLTELTSQGYPVVDYGNSWVYTVKYDDNGVQAQGYVTYSQSTDPASPHYSDYTEAYANKEWPVLPFTDEQIEASKIREMDLTP